MNSSRSKASTSDNNRWICPNDRVLTFRAKLHAGWSNRSTSSGNGLARSATPSPSVSPYASAANLSITPSSSYADVGSTLAVNNNANVAGNQVTSSISEDEQEKILSVISRARAVEQMEKERIQRLTDRLNNMQRNSGGDGRDHCALCSEKLRMFSIKTCIFVCCQCSKSVCSKCAVDQVNPETNVTVYFCKLCSESREIWKKSGAWFLKSLPTFPLASNRHLTSTSSLRSPSTYSTTSYAGHSNQYCFRFESPFSPTDSSNSVESSMTLNSLPPNMPPSPTPSSASQLIERTRSCQPPSSLPVTPSSKPKQGFYYFDQGRK